MSLGPVRLRELRASSGGWRSWGMRMFACFRDALRARLASSVDGLRRDISTSGRRPTPACRRRRGPSRPTTLQGRTRRSGAGRAAPAANALSRCRTPHAPAAGLALAAGDRVAPARRGDDSGDRARDQRRRRRQPGSSPGSVPRRDRRDSQPHKRRRRPSRSRPWPRKA